MNLRWVDAFALQVFIGIAAGREQQRGEAIRNDAVDFFRHGSVKASKTRFDVGNWNDKLGRNDTASHG